MHCIDITSVILFIIYLLFIILAIDYYYSQLILLSLLYIVTNYMNLYTVYVPLLYESVPAGNVG